ncbi:methionine--tRNA ligase [Parasphaerochaeta coccoides]|nr:methionine--tRNA ligase [Parasphaerochaeta coccoides]
MKKRRLITSALPYVNNIPHLGNLTQVLSADVFARFCRSKGYETLYVCGTDEYGTATETKALQEGVTPQELCDRYHAIHRDIYRWFNISFDHFGRTSTPLQTKIVQDIFNAVDANGYIHEHEIEQLYCTHDQMYLADRYVTGTCPHCAYENARGDQCENCGTLLNPTDLIKPVCGVCGNTPELRKTKHLYLDLPQILPLLEEWMQKASVEGFWANNAIQMTKAWIREGLKERGITRDLKWSIPVPRKGYENKVFYVWFDAPIGYISITANLTDQWETWWRNPENVELFQFIGKDNIPFHTVIFPSSQLATGQKWTMLHHMSSTEYLNYEGGKFSKSKGIGIFGNDVQDTGIPVDIWRFYMYYNRPETSDVTFTWKDFQEKVNGELIGNLSNLVNRTLSFIKRFYDGELPSGSIDENLMTQVAEKEAVIEALLERAEERDALRTIFALSDIGNKAFQAGEPWKTRTTDPTRAADLLTTLVYVIHDIAVLIAPFMPGTSEKILGWLGREGDTWKDLGLRDGIGRIGDVELLFSKLDDATVEALREKYSGSQKEREEREIQMAEPEKENGDMEENEGLAQRFARKVILKVAKITGVERHPGGDKLYILTLDDGSEEPRTIVSSIVPYYKEEELQDRNIVIVANLKPANFRGVKSYGMLLAASEAHDETHSTCEVLFVPELPPGTEFIPEGCDAPDVKPGQIKGEHFFEMPMHTVDGIVKIDGRPVSAHGVTLKAHVYVNGDVG